MMKKEINGLSLIRVIAVLMVLTVHFGQSLPFPSVIHTPIVWCQHGVQLFFLLSGFLIFKSLNRNSDIKAFYKKRIIRIVPLYWFVILLNAVIFGMILKTMPKDNFHLGWLRYFLFLQTIIPSLDVGAWNNISALWTMSAFAWFYLLAPLFYKLMKNYKRACMTVVISLAIGTVFTMAVNQIAEHSIYADSLRYISGKSPVAVMWIFLTGGLLVHVLKENREGVFLLLLSIWGLIYGYYGVTMVVIFAYLILLVQGKNFDFGKIINALIHVVDEYSFSIFSTHYLP